MARSGDLNILGLYVTKGTLYYAVVNFLDRSVVNWGVQDLPQNTLSDKGQPNPEILANIISHVAAPFDSIRSVHVCLAEGIVRHDIVDLHGLSETEIGEVIGHRVAETPGFEIAENPAAVYFQARDVGGDTLFEKTPVYYLYTPDLIFQPWLSTLDQSELRVGGLSGIEQIVQMLFLLSAEAAPQLHYLNVYIGETHSEISLFSGHQLIELHHLSQTEASLRQWDDEQQQLIQRVKSIFLGVQGRYAGGIDFQAVHVFSWNGQFRNLADRLKDACKAQTSLTLEPRGIFSKLPDDTPIKPEIWCAAAAALVEGARVEKELRQPTLLDRVLGRKYFFSPQSLALFTLASLVIVLINVAALSYFKINQSFWKSKNTQLELLAKSLPMNTAELEKKRALYAGLEQSQPAFESFVALLQNNLSDDAWISTLKFVPPRSIELYGNALLESSVQSLVSRLNQYMPSVELRSVENVSAKNHYETRFVIGVELP